MIGATKPSDLHHDLTLAYLLNRGDSTLLDQNNRRFDSFILPESQATAKRKYIYSFQTIRTTPKGSPSIHSQVIGTCMSYLNQFYHMFTEASPSAPKIGYAKDIQFNTRMRALRNNPIKERMSHPFLSKVGGAPYPTSKSRKSGNNDGYKSYKTFHTHFCITFSMRLSINCARNSMSCFPRYRQFIKSISLEFFSYEYSSLESKLPRKAQGIDLMNATSSTISFFFLGRQARAQVWGYGPISFLSYENGSVNEKHRRQRKGKLQQQKLVSMKTIR